MRNTKWILVALVFGLSLNSIICYGQRTRYRTRYISHAILSGRPKADTLVDKSDSTKFILDTAGIYITAINSSGKQLWKTDPWKDNKLEEYRVKRPVVARFYFGDYYYGDSIIYTNKLKGRKAKEIEKNKKKYTREAIWIAYNNTQFGVADKATGRFSWLGQD